MAQKSIGGTQHGLHKGLSSRQVDGAGDKSRKIASKRSVDDEAVRSGVACGDYEKGPDSGQLK